MKNFSFLAALLLPIFSFAQGFAYPVCERALIDAKEVFSPYNLSLYGIGANDGHAYRARTFKPQYGVGRLIFLEPKKFDPTTPPPLLRTILKFPLFFLRYDMRANGSKFIIPDTVRLNQFMKNGVQFESIPFYKFFQQYYSEEEFQFKLSQGLILVASTGEAFYHDRMEEHLMGALILPRWLYERYLYYNKFDQALLQSTFVKSGSELVRQFVQSYSALRSSPGRNWDSMTNLLGWYLERELPASTEPVEKHHIERMIHILRMRADHMTPGPTSALRDEMNKRGDITYFDLRFIQGVTDLEKQFVVEKVSDEKILEETLRIIHEVHGTPVENLLKIWESKFHK